MNARDSFAFRCRLLPARALACLVAAILLLPPAPVFAQDPDGSLDNMWNEQEPASQEKADDGDSGAPASPEQASAPATAAPLCSLQDFQESHLVKKGGWPGVGPFKSGPGGPYELVDPALNHLKIHVADEKVTEAELVVVKDKSGSQDLLELQMNADFLLESVGVRPRKIVNFNSDLEKNKETLLAASEGGPVNLAAGRHRVSIQKKPVEGSEKVKYLISVSSLDASREIIQQHSVDNGKGSGKDAVPEVAVAPPPEPAPDAGEVLRQEFLDLIQNWQQVKKSVTRNKQVSELKQVLSGRALALQTNAVQWLISNHKYWEMNPEGVDFDNYKEITPGRKYHVLVRVRQSRKLVDDSSGQVLKEARDDDKVNYTVEKINDKWFITDYSIVGASPASQASKPQPAPTNR